ncbi:DUF3592 domain-containing protein [Streptomyces collinus]|uniref:DUF3592 domain-containing protein n=1 Tax=Streptomyces collinus TaxID=42684 RepID=UPI0036E82C9B
MQTKSLTRYVTDDQENGSFDEYYTPQFSFRVSDGSGRYVDSSGYAIGRGPQLERAQAQKILDSYQIGKTYPCWFDPGNHEKAVLTRSVSGWILLIPSVIMLLVGLAIPLGGIVLARRWRRAGRSTLYRSATAG